MTRIVMWSTDGHYYLRADGHATGRPDVCAAISTLVQALDSWLSISGVDVIRRRIASGHAELYFSGGPAVRAAYQVVEAGMTGLCAAAPENVSLSRGAAPSTAVYDASTSKA